MTTERKPIGIFAYGASPIEHMPWRRTRALLAEAALQGAELRFFSTDDCNLTATRVTADIWRHQEFQRRETDLPPLVLIITDPLRPRHDEIGKWLRTNTTVLADRGPNKIEQVRLLERSPLARYAIPSELLNHDRPREQLSDWLVANGSAVLKPVDGMRGGSIHFVVRDGARWRLMSRGMPTQEGPLNEIVGKLASAIAGRARYRRFMVQRYIRSTNNGLAISLRADMHKKPDESWRLTRAVARVNATGGLSTNFTAGGANMVLDRFLRNCIGDRRANEFHAKVEAIAMSLADLIDVQPDTSIRELGVDFAVENFDTLWIVEANVQLDADTFEHERAVYVIEYALSRLG